MKLAEASHRLEQAMAQRSAGGYAAALAELEPLLALDLPPAAALTLAGECLILDGRPDEAETHLRTAALLAPRDADALLELAHHLHAWGRFGDREVRQLLATARRCLADGDVSASLLEASLHADAGEHDDEKRVLQSACDRHPDSAILRETLKSVPD